MSDPGDICDCGACDAECNECSALADVLDMFNEGYCERHWAAKQQNDNERADQRQREAHHGGGWGAYEWRQIG